MPATRLLPILLLFAASAAAGEPKLDRHGDPLPEGAVARLGTVKAHPGVRSIAFAPDGKSLITVGTSSVRYWDATSGRMTKLVSLPVAENSRDQMISDDGRVMVRIMEDHIAVHDIQLGKVRFRVPLKETTSSELTGISPDGRLAILGLSNDAGNEIHTWILSLENGKSERLKNLEKRPTQLALSPNGNLLATLSNDDGFQCRDRTSGKLLIDTIRHLQPLAFSADSTRFVAAGQWGDYLDVWELGAGKPIELPRLKMGRTTRNNMFAAVAAFSPDASNLAANIDGRMTIWDLKTSQVIRTWPSMAICIAFSPDGKRLATSDGLVQIWDVATGKPLLPDFGPMIEFGSPSETESASLTFSNLASGRIATWSEARQTLVTWDIANGKPTRSFDLSDNNVFNMQTIWLSPDASRVVTCSIHNIKEWLAMIQVLSVESGKELSRFSPVPPGEDAIFWTNRGASARVVDGGRTIAVAMNHNDDGQHGPLALARWEIDSKKPLGFQKLGQLEQCKGRIFITGNGRGVIHNGMRFHIEEGPGKSLLLANIGEALWRMFDLSKDGRLIAADTTSFNDDESRLYIWELASGRPMIGIPHGEDWFGRVQLSPDGRWLAVARAAAIELWDVAEGKRVPFHKPHPIAEFGNESHGYCQDLAFLPDGKHLIAAHGDWTALVWELPPETRKPSSHRMIARTWDDLASLDARIGHNAVWAMRNEPAKAIALLKERLKPAHLPAAKELEPLIADLGAPQYAKREAAQRGLRQFGQTIEPMLREAARTVTSAEQRRRLNQISTDCQNIASRTADEIRAIRCVQVLESITKPEARQLLQDLSKGAESAILTRESRNGLKLAAP